MFRKLLVTVLAGAALVVAGAPAVTAAPAPVASTAKSCSSGYTHAVINGQQKCLRRGQFCTHSADRQYRRYGFRCTKYYANVQRYRLT